MTVAALYVDPNGVYANLPGVDVWDEARDARLYDGPWPVVAHPPCATWCRLAPWIEAIGGRRRGDDGGCFAAALGAVRRFGGVLEHPASSYAWGAFGLPRPLGGHWIATLSDPGWVCEVSQAAYGHLASKLTWLYYVGEAPPEPLDTSRPAARAKCGHDPKGRRPNLPRLRDADAARTPLAFRDVLLAMARGVNTPSGMPRT